MYFLKFRIKDSAYRFAFGKHSTDLPFEHERRRLKEVVDFFARIILYLVIAWFCHSLMGFF